MVAAAELRPDESAVDTLRELARGCSALAIRLQVERPDRVVVQLNRPERRNAIDDVMVAEFHALCAWLERHPRILILTGAETTGSDGAKRGVFAAGADIRQLHARRQDDALRGVNSSLFVRVHRLPMPVIAAIDGYAFGGGAELAYAADFRLASPAAQFAQPEVGLGISAAAGALWRLKELVGEPVALDMLLAGRVLTAAEALELRLVSAIHDTESLIDAAHHLADRIGAQDPLAVRITKRVFHMPREAHPYVDELGQALLFESEAKDMRMQAFLDARADRKES